MSNNKKTSHALIIKMIKIVNKLIVICETLFLINAQMFPFVMSYE